MGFAQSPVTVTLTWLAARFRDSGLVVYGLGSKRRPIPSSLPAINPYTPKNSCIWMSLCRVLVAFKHQGSGRRLRKIKMMDI